MSNELPDQDQFDNALQRVLAAQSAVLLLAYKLGELIADHDGFTGPNGDDWTLPGRVLGKIVEGRDFALARWAHLCRNGTRTAPEYNREAHIAGILDVVNRLSSGGELAERAARAEPPERQAARKMALESHVPPWVGNSYWFTHQTERTRERCEAENDDPTLGQ